MLVFSPPLVSEAPLGAEIDAGEKEGATVGRFVGYFVGLGMEFVLSVDPRTSPAPLITRA